MQCFVNVTMQCRIAGVTPHALSWSGLATDTVARTRTNVQHELGYEQNKTLPEHEHKHEHNEPEHEHEQNTNTRSGSEPEHEQNTNTCS